MFAHIPGIKCVIPSSAYDAKGLMIQAVRDNDPVIFFEHKVLYDEAKDDVPEEAYTIPFGEANIVREGGDCTIVAIARMVHKAKEAAEALARRKASNARSSIRVRSRRSTRTRSWKASRIPAGWSWSTRPIRAATWRPTSPRSSRRKAFAALKAPIQMVSPPHAPGTVRAGAGGRLHSQPGEDRRRGAQDDELDAMSDERILAITVPKWGMAMEEGTVTAWHLDEGAKVDAGDEVLDVESTKIANAIEAKTAGVLRRRVAGVGQTLPVGALLGVIAPAEVGDEEIESFVSGFVVEAADEEGADSGPQPQTIEAGGRTIRYLVHRDEPAPAKAGGGTPIVLVHGFGGDLNAWMFNQPVLAAGRAVYAIDLPGHGGSSKDVGDGSIATLADTLVAFLDAAGLDCVHFVGHSLGGAVALHVALGHAGRVASLTLVAPAGLGAEINGAYIAGFVAAQRRKDMKPLAEQLFADAGLVTRQMVEDILKAKRIDGADAALAAIAAANFPAGRQVMPDAGRLADLAVPAQVIWGEADAIIPAAHARALPGATVHRLPGVGHMAMMEAATRVNELIAAFVA